MPPANPTQWALQIQWARLGSNQRPLACEAMGPSGHPPPKSRLNGRSGRSLIAWCLRIAWAPAGNPRTLHGHDVKRVDTFDLAL